MKIAPIITKFPQANFTVEKTKEDNSFSSMTNLISTQNDYSLPSFHSVGKSLAFKGKDDGENVKKVKEKIDETKAAIKALKTSTGSIKSPDVAEAYQKIGDYDYWQSTKDATFEYAQKEAEKARVANKKWYGSYGVAAKEAKMNELYWKKHYEYDLYSSEESKYRTIISLYEQTENQDATGKAAQIKLLEDKLVELETNIDFASLYDKVNKTVNNSGGIDERIAGYEDVKDEISRTFVGPLTASMKDPTVKVPPAVMLYGATGCGKTTFLEAIRNQSKDHAQVIDLSTELSAESKSFKRQLDAYLAQAAKTYQNTGKRTIFLLNEAEQYFCMNKEDIDNSGMFLDESDMRKIEEYGSTSDSTMNVNNFKSTFDYISKLPTTEDPRGCASTIFITSNYPHLIHRDLLSRDGRYGKLMSIAVKPASDNNLRAVIKHYFRLYSDLLETIKMVSKKDNYADLIKSLPDISNKGKDVLIQKVKDGTIANMHIDPTCSEFKNFDQFIKGNNPSLVRGAYSNARLQNIADKAFSEYLKNPAVPFETHFCNVKREKGTDIQPAEIGRAHV